MSSVAALPRWQPFPPVGSWVKVDKEFTHFIQQPATEYPWRSRMATGSELQLIIFAGEACEKSRLDCECSLFSFAPRQRFLRRANEPQKCFVSGETESVANTSAFVGPVAFSLPSRQNH